MAISILSSDIWHAKQRRLSKLEQQAASYGMDTPPQIATEIEDLQRELAQATPATVEESHPILFTLLQETRADVRRLYWMLPILMVLLCIFMVALVKL